jgi:hypothetical protein
MRVWRINEYDWVAGPTILAALRAAKRERGYGALEMIDRSCFREIPRERWAEISVYDADRPDDLDLTLEQIVAGMVAPGIAMCVEP